MTSITQNLPWFIKDLGVSIVGQECYTSLVEHLQLSDVKCLKYSLSKGLGIGIVLGGAVVKIPQILLITSARSARGLSLEAYVLETLSYAITLAYSVRNAFPFTTYGENLFLTLQNALITLLILAYAPAPARARARSTRTTLALAALLLAGGGAALAALPPRALHALQLTTLPLALAGKLPQVRANARARSTGQLSALAVGAQLAGCAARLFTTAQEVRDAGVLAGFALALVLNAVLAVQIWAYWGRAAPEEQEEKVKETVPHAAHASGAQLHAPVASRAAPVPAALRTATPPPRTPSSAGARKWARKAD